MARKPLDIPWNDVFLDGGGPAVEVVVSTRSDGRGAGGGGGGEGAGGCASEGCDIDKLSDRDLTEKIRRMKSPVLLQKLQDKGAKLKAHLLLLEEEVERRRKAVPASGNDRMEPESAARSRDGPLSESSNKSSSNLLRQPCHSSSFTSIFSKSLDDRQDRKSYTAFSAELGCLGGSCNNLKQTRPQINERARNVKMSLRQSPFTCPSRIANKEKKNSTGENYKPSKRSALCKAPSPKSFSSMFTRFSRRRIDRGNYASRDLKSDEVQEVVLLDEEDAEPTNQMQEDNNESLKVKIYYPSRSHTDCVEICYSDIKCLDPESYLSSTIMNFYIQYLQKPISAVGRPKREYHFFNTYFYKKLEDALSSKVDKGTNLSKLRRWFKGVNLFEKSYILLPIHGNMHWSLVIICIPAKEDGTGPIILHLDSLGFHDSKVIFSNIKSYLKEEWEHKNKAADSGLLDTISEETWKHLPDLIKLKRIMVPQQKNEYDCGLFVLHFMQRFIEEAPDRIRIEDLDMFGSKWFHPGEASGLRKRLRELLIEEFEDARLKDNERESPESSASSLDGSI